MIDIHAHLCFPQFNEDREKVIAKCKEELTAVIVSSARYDESLCVLKIVREHKGFLFASLGCHPTELQDAKKMIDLIRMHAEEIVAIGEVGLDYHWVKEDVKRKRQKEVFARFIALAEELEKPLILHTWDAEKDAFEMVKHVKIPVVFHCFSGSLELLKDILSRGFYVSISTHVLFSKHHRKLVRVLPLENLLLETDSPFLSPVKHERNYPWNIKLSAQKIAEIKHLDVNEVLESAKNNAIRIFNLKL